MGTRWQIEKTVDIRQPPEVVFDYLCRFENVQEWDDSVLRATRLSAGKPTVGSRFRVTLLFGWRRVPMTYEIVSMEPPRRLALPTRYRFPGPAHPAPSPCRQRPRMQRRTRELRRHAESPT